MRRSCDYLELWKFDCLYDDYGVKTHFVPQIEESDPAQSVPLDASTRKKPFWKKKLHPRRDSFCNNPLQTFGDRVIIWRFGNLIAVKTQFVAKLKSQTPLKVCPRKRQLARSVLREKKLHPRRYSFCNKPLQTCGDCVIIWSFGYLIACTMTLGSKHTSFPKLKNQTSPKVCPWRRQLARSDLRGKNSIHGGTHFAIIPFKRPEIPCFFLELWKFDCLYDDFGVKTHFVAQI